MIERQQQEALYTDGTPVLAQDIFWEGRPSFLPFLLGSESMMAMTAVWFLLFWYFDFTKDVRKAHSFRCGMDSTVYVDVDNIHIM